MQNIFTVNGSGNTAVINDIFTAFAAGKRACGYIYVTTNRGISYFPAQPASANFDPGRGVPYASYQSILGLNDLPDASITSAGFAFDTYAHAHISTCALDIKKNAGERLIISGTLYLDASARLDKDSAGESFGGAVFNGGDNPLVKVFLGAEAFKPQALKISTGQGLFPLAPFNLTKAEEAWQDCFETAAVFTPRQISITHTQGNPQGGYSEALLLYKDKIAARVRPDAVSFSMVGGTAAANGRLILNGHILSVSNVRLNNSALINYSFFQVPSLLHFFTEEEFKIPPSACITADPARSVFGAADNGTVTLYRARKGRLEPFLWEHADAVSLLSNGRAVFYEHGKISLVNTADSLDRHEFAVPHCDNYEAVFHNGLYMIIGTSGSTAHRHIIDSGFKLESSVIQIDGAPLHLVNFGVSIGVVGRSGFKVFGVLGEDAQYAAWLGSSANLAFLQANTNRRTAFESDRLIFYNEDTGHSAYIDLFTDGVTQLDASGRIKDEFLFKSTADGWAAALVSEPAVDLVKNTGRVKTAFRQDEYLYLFLEDGTVRCYIASSDRVRLSSPSISAGDFITCTAVRQDTPAGRITITMRN